MFLAMIIHEEFVSGPKLCRKKYSVPVSVSGTGTDLFSTSKGIGTGVSVSGTGKICFLVSVSVSVSAPFLVPGHLYSTQEWKSVGMSISSAVPSF